VAGDVYIERRQLFELEKKMFCLGALLKCHSPIKASNNIKQA
jgi:hypothetical protein